MSKITTLKKAVDEYVKPRSHLAFGGFPQSRRPTVFCKEIVKQFREKSGIDLCISSVTIGTAGIGLLLAEGLVESVITSILTSGGKRNPNTYRTICDGKPRRIRMEEHSNLTMNMKYLAGALNIPFIPSHSGKCTGLRTHGFGDLNDDTGGEKDEDSIPSFRYKKMPVMKDPFGSRQKVALLQALNPDASVIHVPFSDPKGNSIILGSVAYDNWLPHSGRNIIVIADKIVEAECCKQYPNMVNLPGIAVDAVVPWYMGSWPHNSVGLYESDQRQFPSNYFDMCDTLSGLEDYIEEYVLSWDSHEEYMKVIGKKRKNGLEDNPSMKLAEPFLDYITEDY